MIMDTPVASFTKEVNPGLAKCPLVFNSHLVKEATGIKLSNMLKNV